MKIGFFTIDFTWERGGERVTASLVNQLCLSMEVHILSLYQHADIPFFEHAKQVSVHVLAPLIGDRAIPSKSYLKRKQTELGSLRLHLQKNQYDLLIGVGSYTSILLGITKRFTRSKTLMAAWEHSNYHALSSTWKSIRRVAYRKLNAIICLNQEDEREYAKEFKKTVTIPNLISFLSSEKSTLSNKKIISIGAFEYEKGFDLLLLAFKYLCERVDDWDLTLVGSGSQKDRLIETIRDLNLGSRVQVLDPVKEIEQEFLKASIYVMASRREGFGMVLLEAMECGLACVSFDCPTGPRNIIDSGINGILVPPEDTVQLAEALEKIIRHPDEMKKLAAAGISSVKPYYKESIVSKWIYFINTVTGGKLPHD